MGENQDWKDWGIRDHWNIPEQLLEAMASAPGFDINIVRQAAAAHVAMYMRMWRNQDEPHVLPRRLIENQPHRLRSVLPVMIQRAMSKEELKRSRDKSNYFSLVGLGQILEYCMVADAMEEFIRSQPTRSFNGDQP